MGQLDINEDSVGINSYRFDRISAGIRKKLVIKVFRDLRHLKTETIARLASCGIMGTPEGQYKSPAYERLHSGLEPCTMCFVHPWESSWMGEKQNEGPRAIIQYMAATAVVAAMYDIVIQSTKTPV